MNGIGIAVIGTYVAIGGLTTFANPSTATSPRRSTALLVEVLAWPTQILRQLLESHQAHRPAAGSRCPNCKGWGTLGNSMWNQCAPCLGTGRPLSPTERQELTEVTRNDRKR